MIGWQMLLSRKQTGQVLRGTKTQVRLPAKTATRFTVDRSYPVRSGDSEPLRCRVIVQEVVTCELGAITQKDAIKEGHRTTDDFRFWWVVRHDRRWLEQHEEDEILTRFESYHAHRPVIAVRFSLDPAVQPRFLMPLGAPGGDELGYTSNVGRSDRDIDEALHITDQKWITADAHDRALGLPGRREEALRREAGQLSRRLKHEVRIADVDDWEVVAQLERIRSEIGRLESIRGRKAA